MLKGSGGGGSVSVMGRVANGRPAEAGDVLVTRMTDPGMLGQIMKSVAVVTDEGGAFCHAAVICQQMGIPFIVGTKKATTLLVDGAYVSVDPVSGTVEVIE